MSYSLKVVSYDMAHELNSIGFNDLCDLCYLGDIKNHAFSTACRNVSEIEGAVYAPRLARVLDWFLDYKDLYITTAPCKDLNGNIGHATIVYDLKTLEEDDDGSVIPVWTSIDLCPTKPLSATKDEAIEEGIKFCIDKIKNNEPKSS